MRRTLRPVTATLVSLLALGALLSAAFVASAPHVDAQDDLVSVVLDELERDGFYIEAGGDGSRSGFADLVRQGDRAADNWYFVSMADTVPADFADDLFDRVSPEGNVLVYFIDGDGVVNVQLASNESESVEDRSLAPFDGDWNQPEDFMTDVISEFDRLRSGTSTSTSGGTTGSTTGSSDSSSSGGGFPWLLVGIPVLLIGGVWFMSRQGKKKKAEDQLETAQKIRAELQTELDELANDVLVLSEPTDLSDKTEAINYYREATDTYLDISEELPEGEELAQANLRELSELGARVAHARWQMDAAEAILDGEPIPEKPKVEPPPAPKRPTPRPQEQQRRQMPRRQARPRVPYSRSRRRSGGGLLDILIAGAGMMGGRRSGGGMFGGGSSGRSSGGMFGGGSRTQSRQSAPRPGGGVFGGGRSSRSSNRGSSRTSSRRSSRSSSRRSSGRASTSRRRRRGGSGRFS